ncbi:MAG: hypothetical protein J6S12_04715 [Alphaproteobacteria bacterium]|nr:hypothetical protein [Alphaproteobacteria bacterium]
MKNKIFATMGGAIAALCPWVTHAETFPTDGNMLENKTYESAATYNNLGTYEGPVSAAAEYADILYQVGAGQYLPAGSEGVGALCTTGNYCPGLTDATYNATDSQGLTACPNGYPNSDAGASMNTQCYTTCTDKSVIAHATAVAGNDYYGNGTDTCYPTACDNGYHTYNGIEMFETDPLAPGADVSVTATTYGSISANGTNKYHEGDFGLTEAGTWADSFSYGTVYGQASCQPEGDATIGYVSGVIIGQSPDVETVRSELTTIAGEDAANAMADVYAEYKAGTKTSDDLWKTAYAILGSEYDAHFSKTDSGQYCYCQMTDFKPTDGVKIPVTSAPWVFKFKDQSADNCAKYCASTCANDLQSASEYYRGFRAAVLGTLGTRTVGVCAANEISITWADADPADVAANNAGVCTYDGDIRTPVKAITKPGKTFKGWKFNKAN